MVQLWLGVGKYFGRQRLFFEKHRTIRVSLTWRNSQITTTNAVNANESMEKRYKGGESLEARGLSAVPEHASLAVILV